MSGAMRRPRAVLRVRPRRRCVARGARILLLCSPLFSVAPTLAHAQRSGAVQGIAVQARNPLPVARPGEVIAIPWVDLRGRLRDVGPDRVRVVDSATGAEVVSQVVEGNGDGEPDELLFQADFWPGQHRAFRVEAATPTAAHPSRAFARHDAYRDDVAWETDRIAFRMYGQGLWNASEYDPLVSSGIDVWLKRVREPIVERWYEKGHDAYHVDTGEGADFYTVGPTLGAGGSAVWHDGRLHHARNFKSHRILANGPIRVVFELEYEPWDAGGRRVAEVKRITMDAGQNLFRQEITYRFDGADPITYAVGTVKREGLVGSTSGTGSWAWLSTWGPVERKNGGHGSLGTAVLLERSRLLETRGTDDHYLVLATARSGAPTVQYVGAGWTASGDFSDVSAWWSHLDGLAQRLAAPIEVRFGEP